MASHYKLLFRGAVHKGQHAAVVRPKLQALLKASDAQMDVMFSGKPVTIKKAVAEPVAERYLDAFIDAGAKLELVEVAAPAAAPAAASTDAPAAAPTAASPAPEAQPQTQPQPQAADAASAFQLAEVGSRLGVENAAARTVENAGAAVSTDHLTLASPGTTLGNGDSAVPDEVPAVDVSHLQLDQPGVRLGVPEAAPDDAVLLAKLDFELGEVGETLVESKPQNAPELPDVSHLQLETNEEVS